MGIATPPSYSSGQPASEHPARWKFGYPIFHAETREQWRAWLEVNHAVAKGVWLCSWRSSDRARCAYPDVVAEAICFGWIDSTVNVLDDDRALQLLTPRRAKSPWTRLNRQRFADMEAAGLMTDAGRHTADQAKASGWWTVYDPVEDLLEPLDLSAALDASASARRAWERFPPSARKQMLWWIISAARADTRAQRIATTVSKASIGERARG